MKKRIVKFIFILSALLFCFWLPSTCSAEFIQVPVQKVERLEEIFLEQENLINQLLNGSEISAEILQMQKIEVQELKNRIINLQSKIDLTEDDLKRSNALLLRAEILLEELEKRHKKEVRRLKQQRNLAYGALSVSVIGGIFAITK